MNHRPERSSLKTKNEKKSFDAVPLLVEIIALEEPVKQI